MPQILFKANEQVWFDGSAELGKLSHWARKYLGASFSLSHRPNAGKPPCSHLQKCFTPPSAGFGASSPSLSHQPGVFAKDSLGPRICVLSVNDAGMHLYPRSAHEGTEAWKGR